MERGTELENLGKQAILFLNTTWRQQGREFYEVRKVFWTKSYSQNLGKLNLQNVFQEYV